MQSCSLQQADITKSLQLCKYLKIPDQHLTIFSLKLRTVLSAIFIF
jgi:hypothetical protein